MAQEEERSWQKSIKQIQGAMGCVAGLRDSWPAGLDGCNRRLCIKIGMMLSQLLEEAMEAKMEMESRTSIDTSNGKIVKTPIEKDDK